MTELANEFNPDWNAMSAMVEEQQRMAKRIEELEAALAQPKLILLGGGIGRHPEPIHKPMHPELRKMYEDYFDAAFKALAPLPREWQGLTEEDIAILWKATPHIVGLYTYTDIARQIEAKLMEKNCE